MPASLNGRAIKRFLRIAGMVLLVAAVAPAWAQAGKNGRPMAEPDRRGVGDQQREQRREQMREQMREREDMRRGPHDMSPEDRRQLRRDIRDHGREVYRDRDARRRNGPRR